MVTTDDGHINRTDERAGKGIESAVLARLKAGFSRRTNGRGSAI
jgi:hypothetical protein